MPQSAFTILGNGIVNEFQSECIVSEGFDPLTELKFPRFLKFNGLWDTGASHSAISTKVVEDLNLKPIGKSTVVHAAGQHLVDVFMINIVLPNSIAFPMIRASNLVLTGMDILIGMDIINQGDFAITNLNGISKMSFAIPSSRNIDFMNVNDLGF